MLPKLAIIANGVALEAFVDEIKTQCIDTIFSCADINKSDFIEWLNSRMSSDKLTEVSDQEFFADYLGHDTTESISEDSMWSKVSNKLDCDAMSQSAVYLTQMILHYRKKQLKGNDRITPTVHELHKIFAGITQGKLGIQPKCGPRYPYYLRKRVKKHQSRWSASIVEISEKLQDLMRLIIGDQEESWQIWRQEEGKTSVQEVKCTSYQGLAHLSNLFYGIRNVFAHGTTEYTTQYGVLREKYGPKNASDFDLEITGMNPSNKSHPSNKDQCEQYLFSLWEETRTKGKQMNGDYYLFRTMHSFYIYFAAIMCTMCACWACGLCDERLLQKASRSGGQDIAKIKGLSQKAKWVEFIKKLTQTES